MSLYTPERYTKEQVREVEKLIEESIELHDRLDTLIERAEAVLEIDVEDSEDIRWDDGHDAIMNKGRDRYVEQYNARIALTAEA